MPPTWLSSATRALQWLLGVLVRLASWPVFAVWLLVRDAL